MVTLRAALALAVLPTLALAQPVEIPGPEGPLGAEMIAVDGAAHAVIIIPGSGLIDRDGNAAGTGINSDLYRQLAEGLAEAGVASLRIDKRGLFSSAAAISDPNDVTVAGYAEDARAWVERAAELAPCAWIAGHSEGGLIALAAAQDPPANLCGLILLATPGRPLGVIIREQVAAQPGAGPLIPALDAALVELEAGRAVDPADVPPPLQPLLALSVQGYMIDLLAQDPAGLARNWAGPALIVQGEADVQVRALDADHLAAALPQAARADLPGATHLLKPDVPGQPLITYTDPDQPLHPGLIPAITRMLGSHPPG